MADRRPALFLDRDGVLNVDRGYVSRVEDFEWVDGARECVANFNRRPIPDSVMDSVMSFFFLFALSFAVMAVLLSLMGLDFLTAVSGAATAISNVGPGLGPVIGPAGHFAPLPDGAKWLLSFAMLVGRLELFTILVLLDPDFWSK